MAGGVFFFGFFLLDKQKKEPRQSGETDTLKYGAMPFSYCALRLLITETIHRHSSYHESEAIFSGPQQYVSFVDLGSE
jgi:hypothetical protein